MKTRTVLRTVAPLCILVMGVFPGVQAQDRQSEPSQEFRGTWIATVSRLDWPHGNTPAAQQAELLKLMDGLKAAGMNTVFFQIRGEADAFYDSPYEPWSKFLTGRQGQAPEPFYDPLAFAIEAAHERGMELHAWLNPFRASRNLKQYPLDPTHVSVSKKGWIIRSGPLAMLDPGLPAVRDYVSAIVADVVKRYDVDGIHFDDYFYPYPPNELTNQDAPTFSAYNRGMRNVAAWRRDNINRFVAQVAQTIRAIDPEVKFGISPFGIWKQGVPKGVAGMDAYSLLYADPLTWLSEGYVDYVIPQLYWSFEGAQSYPALAEWWATVRSKRHLYIGHGLYKTDQATYSGPLMANTDITQQLQFNRAHAHISGSAFFRARNLIGPSAAHWGRALSTEFYGYAAPTPTMAWKDVTRPAPPNGLRATASAKGQVALTWEPPEEAAQAKRYAVYRVPLSGADPEPRIILWPRYRMDLTGLPEWVDRTAQAETTYAYYVTSLSANSVESLPSTGVRVETPGLSKAAHTVDPPERVERALVTAATRQ